ncbi:peroxiredoxin [Methylobacterium aerolatum]|uniref:Peroxiredoxin n=1 Tax=Methylobacterium aerolatum TaxID=418708 RepID=A0ABU0HU18_9HYPH|nr:peroxiredoxin [Methylobacterium aerolatum]MDQ0445771.1 peroxiredoxin [Methylobacterium aerolatum]GJD35968.1 Peroxiredoxin Bcp [Methylobacterium aerolatum]
MSVDLASLPADLPAPQDDGGADHLRGARVPDVALRATDGSTVSLAKLKGRTVVYAYPRTGEPGKAPLVDDWDAIPGARGCTPQSCDFRDHFQALKALGVGQVHGLSTQTREYQQEAATRLHLPFTLLSDSHRALAMAARLPTLEAGGETLLKRLTLVIDDGVVTQVFYPVFPPDQSARQVIAWLESQARA